MEKNDFSYLTTKDLFTFESKIKENYRDSYLANSSDYQSNMAAFRTFASSLPWTGALSYISGVENHAWPAAIFGTITGALTIGTCVSLFHIVRERRHASQIANHKFNSLLTKKVMSDDPDLEIYPFEFNQRISALEKLVCDHSYPGKDSDITLICALSTDYNKAYESGMQIKPYCKTLIDMENKIMDIIINSAREM